MCAVRTVSSLLSHFFFQLQIVHSLHISKVAVLEGNRNWSSFLSIFAIYPSIFATPFYLWLFSLQYVNTFNYFSSCYHTNREVLWPWIYKWAIKAWKALSPRSEMAFNVCICGACPKWSLLDCTPSVWEEKELGQHLPGIKSASKMVLFFHYWLHFNRTD